MSCCRLSSEVVYFTFIGNLMMDYICDEFVLCTSSYSILYTLQVQRLVLHTLVFLGAAGLLTFGCSNQCRAEPRLVHLSHFVALSFRVSGRQTENGRLPPTLSY